MAAGLRALYAVVDLLDVILEVRDARLPSATAVLRSHPRLRNKPTVVILNRQDLAQPDRTAEWLSFLRDKGQLALSITATRSGSLHKVRTAIGKVKFRSGRLRVGLVGAPNTGKSSLINALARRKKALTENRPGVTRHVRWIPVDERVEVLDTPGVLEARIYSAATAWQLALCGILPDKSFDPEEVAVAFICWARHQAPRTAGWASLEGFARERGMLRKGGEIDRSNTARALLKAFRDGKLGRFTFEIPGDHP